MSEIVFNPFEIQKKILASKKRVIGCFGGKRCISPEAKVLTLDGVKEFGDISLGDHLLSYDQKANQFVTARSTASFPKAKCSGYRVIHERGEFVVSAHHRLLCSNGEYQSVQDIKNQISLCSNERVGTLLSPQETIEELSQKLFSLDVQRLKSRREGCQDHYEFYNYLYGLLPHEIREVFRVLSLPLFDVLKLIHIFYLLPSGYVDVLDHMKLRYSHLYLPFFQNSNLGVMGRVSFQCESISCNHSIFDIFERFLHISRPLPQSLLPDECRRNLQLLNQSSLGLKDVFSCSSCILGIEAVSSRWWWDVEVEGTNNYVSEGAIHHNSGKTEIGAIKSIINQETKPGYTNNGIDPYIGIIIAPTNDMLRRLSIKKFLAYARPFVKNYNKSTQEIEWHDGSLIYGISADRPQRIEGIKANYCWVDEVLQVSEQLFLECKARTADTQGYILCTGSLGTQYNNPKSHWCYKYFKENKKEDVDCFEWTTFQNPYFPREEIGNLKNELDPRTFRQMFEIDWDVPGTALVYDQLDSANYIKNFVLKYEYEIYVSIDWGFAHDMACLFFAYDRQHDIVYLFDEIVSKRMTIEQLYNRIMDKGYPITGWVCDIAGNQTREQTGISNMEWFARPPRNIHFKSRRTAIGYGIPIVRSYIRDGKGRVKFYIAEDKCPKSLDQLRNYSYPEKNGTITDENPIKQEDDCCDSLRYYFCAILDDRLQNKTAKITKYI